MSMIRIILVELLQSMEWGHIDQHVIVCIIKTPKIDRLTFLKEQVPVMRRLYNKYGYAPNNKKHKLIFIFLCLPIPVRIKDVLLSRVW